MRDLTWREKQALVDLEAAMALMETAAELMCNGTYARMDVLIPHMREPRMWYLKQAGFYSEQIRKMYLESMK